MVLHDFYSPMAVQIFASGKPELDHFAFSCLGVGGWSFNTVYLRKCPTAGGTTTAQVCLLWALNGTVSKIH